MSVISVYVPTDKALPNVVQKFMDNLQDTVEKIPASLMFLEISMLKLAVV